MGFLLGRVTRPYSDIDLVTWFRHRARLERLLLAHGFAVAQTLPVQTDFVRYGQIVSVVFVARGPGGRVVVPGIPQWAWRPGALSARKLTLGAVTWRVMSPAQLLDEYIADGEGRGLRPMTLFFYRQARDRSMTDQLQRVRLQALRPDHVRRWQADLAARNLSATTVRNTHVLLNAALELARRHEWIAVNPCERVKPPRRERPQLRPPTPEEMGRLLDAAEAASDRLAALWTLAAYTGCRPGELLALRWEDVDLDAGAVTIRRTLTKVKRQPVRFGVPKTDGGRRGLRIAPDAVVTLRRHRAAQLAERVLLGPDYEDLGLVFCLDTGEPLLPRHAARRFRQALAQAGLPPAIRFYDLRHGNATAMLLSGVAPKAAAERLGRSSTQLFHQTYAHMLQELDADAAATLQAVIRRRSATG